MGAILDTVVRSDTWDTFKREIRGSGGVNVGGTERILSAVAGVALIGWSLRRRSMRGLLLPLGGGLIARAVTGHCAVNRAVGRDSAQPNVGRTSQVDSVARGEGIRVEKSIVIDRPVAELYRFWRDIENLPRIMAHLESVTDIDGRRSHWIAKAPIGTHVEWDAEIHNERENELLAWRSLPGADINNAGSVHFRPAPDGDGTEIRVVLSYQPPAGKLGAAIARALGEEPSVQLADDLRRFKDAMESDRAAAVDRRG